MAEGIRQVAHCLDPVGEVTSMKQQAQWSDDRMEEVPAWRDRYDL